MPFPISIVGVGVVGVVSVVGGAVAKWDDYSNHSNYSDYAEREREAQRKARLERAQKNLLNAQQEKELAVEQALKELQKHVTDERITLPNQKIRSALQLVQNSGDSSAETAKVHIEKVLSKHFEEKRAPLQQEMDRVNRVLQRINAIQLTGRKS